MSSPFDFGRRMSRPGSFRISNGRVRTWCFTRIGWQERLAALGPRIVRHATLEFVPIVSSKFDVDVDVAHFGLGRRTDVEQCLFRDRRVRNGRCSRLSIVYVSPMSVVVMGIVSMVMVRPVVTQLVILCRLVEHFLLLEETSRRFALARIVKRVDERDGWIQ